MAETFSPFTVTLRHFFFQRGRAYGKLAAAAHIDVKYLYELIQGTKHKPSRDVVIRLGNSLGLDVDETDELLLAAEHAPLVHPRRPPRGPLQDELLLLEDESLED